MLLDTKFNKASVDCAASSCTRARRIQARRSSVHGRGLFALAPLASGEFIIEYTGRRITVAQADRAYWIAGNPSHTFLWSIDGGRVIDAGQGGNSSRWLNHSCEPNLEAHESEDGRVRFHALRYIRPGEELFIDYRLHLEGRVTAAIRRSHVCHCGALTCRGTMLAPKR